MECVHEARAAYRAALLAFCNLSAGDDFDGAAEAVESARTEFEVAKRALAMPERMAAGKSDQGSNRPTTANPRCA